MAEKNTLKYKPEEISPPGATLADLLEERDVSQASLAKRMGRPKKTVNEIIRGVAAITPETALQLEKVFGMPARFWLNRERQYREFLAKREDEKSLAGMTEWAKQFPISQMVKWGWIVKEKTPVGLTRELLEFFSVTSPQAHEDIWDSAQVAFRRSKAGRTDFFALTAWLRKGEIEGESVSCNTFDRTAFRAALPELRKLTLAEPQVFQFRMQEICAKCGVAVVFVPELPKIGAWGATRWMSPNKALIQLSLRNKYEDFMWFAFFHECGHVLLHKKKKLFVDFDNSTVDELDEDAEQEANDFAADTLIPPVQYRSFRDNGVYTAASIRKFAADLGITPGIVVGRLQHDGFVPWSKFNRLKQKLIWTFTDKN